MEPSPYRSVEVGQMSTENFQEINGCLSQLADKLNVLGIFLADSTGQVIAQTLRTALQGDVSALVTLSAGSFAASREIARITGESDAFRMVLYEGEKINLFVSAVSQDYHLTVLFKKETAVGMVRLFVQKAARQLAPLVEGKRDHAIKHDALFNRQFRNLLDDELDRSLTEFNGF